MNTANYNAVHSRSSRFVRAFTVLFCITACGICRSQSSDRHPQAKTSNIDGFSLPLLDFHPVSADPLPATKSAGDTFEVVFANERRRAVELFWSPPKGELKSYGIIAAGRSKRQKTKGGAVWIVRDSFGKPLGHFVVGERDARGVVPEGLSRSLPKSSLKWNPASSGDCPPSSDGGAKTTLTVRNNRTSPVNLHWIDSEGKRAMQFLVKSGTFLPINTFGGHAFLATDQQGQSLGHFIASETPSLADIPANRIPNPGSEKRPAFRPITKPAEELGLDPFYAKCLNLDGYLICSSEKVDDCALREAAYLIDSMLAKRPDLLRLLAAGGSRLTIMAHDEFTTDIPEQGKVADGSGKSNDWWDRRARGLGGDEYRPVATVGEENLLCFQGDPYAEENILIHEFAHTIHLRALNRLDPTFDTRLRTTWKTAMDSGLWKGKYASTAYTEYFAEGVQSWFNNNRENDDEHNHVNTRSELREYDPGLAAICEEVFGDTELVYVKPPDRKNQSHLEEYDYSSAPTFRWPERLKLLDDAVRRRQPDDGSKAK